MSMSELMAALASAQAEFPPIKKTKTAQVRGKTKEGKPYNYGFEYADLADTLQAVRPILGKHGIALLQDFSDDRAHIVTHLFHGEAQWSGGRYPVKSLNPDDPMKYAGAVTFAKRYSLNMALGLHADTLDADDFQGIERRDKEWEPGEYSRPTPIEEVVIKKDNANTWANRWIKEMAESRSAHEAQTLWDLTKGQRDELETIDAKAAETLTKTFHDVLKRYDKDAA